MALRLLLVLFLIAALAWLLKHARTARRPSRSGRPHAIEADLVRCAQCQLYLSREEAVPGNDGSFYCSQAHHQGHEAD